MAVAGLDLSTAGMKVAYGIETEAGTKPAEFVNIPNPKSIPDFNPETNALQSTSLNATEWHTYISGLKDMGGALGITFGMSQVFVDMWNDEIYAAYETAKATNKRMWLEFYHPGLTKGFFFTAEPSKLGFPAADVDAVWDGTANVTPTGEIGWAEAIAPVDESTQG